MKEKLNIFSKNITSQHGEDGIIEYIIQSLGEKINKTCCEFGAWDGIFASNCYNLWSKNNWQAILIEGDQSKFEELIFNTKNFEKVNCIRKYVEIDGPNSIDNIIYPIQGSEDIGLMSIDIDSYDYHIWKEMSLKPQILIIEHNLFIPPYFEYHDPKEEHFLRCSAKSLETLGLEKGYKLICCTTSNSIFIKKELFDKKYFPDFPVEYLFDYSSIQSQIIMTGVSNNRFPIFTKRVSFLRKKLINFYYYVQSCYKSNVSYRPPSKRIKKQLKKFKFDS